LEVNKHSSNIVDSDLLIYYLRVVDGKLLGFCHDWNLYLHHRDCHRVLNKRVHNGLVVVDIDINSWCNIGSVNRCCSL
jgi:hypothetical protein